MVLYLMLYEDPGYSSLLHNILELPCDFQTESKQQVSALPVTAQELLEACVLKSAVASVKGRLFSVSKYHAVSSYRCLQLHHLQGAPVLKKMSRCMTRSGTELGPYSTFTGAFEMVQFLQAESLKDKEEDERH